MMTKTNLFIDLGLLAAFLASMEPRLTGQAIHEWLGIAFLLAIVVHLVLHWDWITHVGKTFFKKLFHSSRFKFVVDVLLFVIFIAVMMSGLMASKVVMRELGISLPRNEVWVSLHRASTDLLLLLIGVHFALSWNWLVLAVKRCIISPLFSPDAQSKNCDLQTDLSSEMR
jgi:hypothetical protein